MTSITQRVSTGATGALSQTTSAARRAVPAAGAEIVNERVTRAILARLPEEYVAMLQLLPADLGEHLTLLIVPMVIRFAVESGSADFGLSPEMQDRVVTWAQLASDGAAREAVKGVFSEFGDVLESLTADVGTLVKENVSEFVG